jgi:hypothetical protein
MRIWDGRELPAEMKVRLVRIHERLRLVEEQISSLLAWERFVFGLTATSGQRWLDVFIFSWF